MAGEKESLACLRQGSVDGITVDHGGVQLVGEFDRCDVANLELHGNDGRNPLPDQALSHAGKRIGVRGTRTFASVENSQAQRTVVVEQRTQCLAGHLPTASIVIGEQQQTVFSAGIKPSVAHEVENVASLPPKPALEMGERRAFQSPKDEKPSPFQILQGLPKLQPLFLHVGMRKVDWA